MIADPEVHIKAKPICDDCFIRHFPEELPLPHPHPDSWVVKVCGLCGKEKEIARVYVENLWFAGTTD
jgi:hypothetical protein